MKVALYTDERHKFCRNIVAEEIFLRKSLHILLVTINSIEEPTWLDVVFQETKMERKRRCGMILVLVVSILLIGMTVGCYSTGVVVETEPVYREAPQAHPPGPPPWAPAHGHRSKHRYWYYPASSVYYEVDRKVYFYYSGGQWRVSVSLPAGLRIDVRDYVTLEMDTPRPYHYHSEVAKRYPPGQLKKHSKEKGKKKR